MDNKFFIDIIKLVGGSDKTDNNNNTTIIIITIVFILIIITISFAIWFFLYRTKTILVTNLSLPVNAGSNKINIQDYSNVKLGHNVVITEGNFSETCVIIGFGSLFLEPPLKYDYTMAAIVTVTESPSTTTSITPNTLAQEIAVSQEAFTRAQEIAASQEAFTRSRAITASQEAFTRSRAIAASQEAFTRAQAIAASQEAFTQAIVASQEAFMREQAIVASQEAFTQAIAASQEAFTRAQAIAASQEAFTRAQAIAASQEAFTRAQAIVASQEAFIQAQAIVASQEAFIQAQAIVASQEAFIQAQAIAASQEAFTRAQEIAASQEAFMREQAIVASQEAFMREQAIAASQEAFMREQAIVASQEAFTRAIVASQEAFELASFMPEQAIVASQEAFELASLGGALLEITDIGYAITFTFSNIPDSIYYIVWNNKKTGFSGKVICSTPKIFIFTDFYNIQPIKLYSYTLNFYDINNNIILSANKIVITGIGSTITNITPDSITFKFTGIDPSNVDTLVVNGEIMSETKFGPLNINNYQVNGDVITWTHTGLSTGKLFNYYLNFTKSGRNIYSYQYISIATLTPILDSLTVAWAWHGFTMGFGLKTNNTTLAGGITVTRSPPFFNSVSTISVPWCCLYIQTGRSGLQSWAFNDGTVLPNTKYTYTVTYNGITPPAIIGTTPNYIPRTINNNYTTTLSPGNYSILVVAGGGGGGGSTGPYSSACQGGGGGAGGVIQKSIKLFKNENVNIVIGGGGCGGWRYGGIGWNCTLNNYTKTIKDIGSTNGLNTTISFNNEPELNIVAFGGGGGGDQANST